MSDASDSAATIRDFLVSRRAKLVPEQVGLPAGGRRRVPGLRREEVASLAGVSTEWYVRLEKGHIAGVSEEVLEAVARALQLGDDERLYLFDLASAAKPVSRVRARRRDQVLEPAMQWLLDSMTLSAGFVRNGRLDIVASNALGRALHGSMFASPTTREHGRANFARFHFLDPSALDFFVDWEAGAATTVALLRAEAGREPNDQVLQQLVGELSTLSPDFCRLWASHDIRIKHDGIKRIQHPVVGYLELTYQSLQLPTVPRAAHELSVYTARPASPHEEQLRLLSSWAATTTEPVA